MNSTKMNPFKSFYQFLHARLGIPISLAMFQAIGETINVLLHYLAVKLMAKYPLLGCVSRIFIFLEFVGYGGRPGHLTWAWGSRQCLEN